MDNDTLIDNDTLKYKDYKYINIFATLLDTIYQINKLNIQYFSYDYFCKILNSLNNFQSILNPLLKLISKHNTNTEVSVTTDITITKICNTLLNSKLKEPELSVQSLLKILDKHFFDILVIYNDSHISHILEKIDEKYHDIMSYDADNISFIRLDTRYIFNNIELIDQKIKLLENNINSKLNVNIELNSIIEKITKKELLILPTLFIIDYLNNNLDNYSNILKIHNHSKDKIYNSKNNKILTKKKINSLYDITKKNINRSSLYNKCIFTESSFLFNQISLYYIYKLIYNIFINKYYCNDECLYFEKVLINILPNYIEYNITLFNTISNSTKKYIYIPISIDIVGPHANTLIINNITKEIYHFDSNSNYTILDKITILYLFNDICNIIKNYDKKNKEYILYSLIKESLTQNILMNNLEMIELFTKHIFDFKYNEESEKEKLSKYWDISIFSPSDIIVVPNNPNIDFKKCVPMKIKIQYKSFLYYIIQYFKYINIDNIIFISEEDQITDMTNICEILNESSDNNRIHITNKYLYSICVNMYNLFKLNLPDYTYHSPFSTVLPNRLIHYSPNKKYDPEGYCIMENYLYILSAMIYTKKYKTIDFNKLNIKISKEYSNNNNEKYLRKLALILRQYIYKFIVYLFDTFNIITISNTSRIDNTIIEYKIRKKILISLRSHLVENFKINKQLYEKINNITNILLLARNIQYIKDTNIINIKFHIIDIYDNILEEIIMKHINEIANDIFHPNAFLDEISDDIFDPNVNLDKVNKFKWDDTGMESINSHNLKEVRFYKHNLQQDFDIINTKSDALNIELQINIIHEFIKEYFRIILFAELFNLPQNMLLFENYIMNQYTKIKDIRMI
jgi:hypothetical protein